MGFNLGKAISGVATGGLTYLPDLLGGKTPSSTATQVPLETPEQTKARKLFLDFAESGKFGNYTAGGDISGFTPGADMAGYTPGAALPGQENIGTPYGAPMGNYDMSALESGGQNKLLGLLNGGTPDIFNTGTDELMKLFTTDTYNPMADTGVFKGFKEQNALDTQDSVDALKRNAAFGGTLYNSDTVRGIGKLETDSARNVSNKLADLYDQFAQRKIAAIPLALQAGQQSQDMNLGLVGASQQYGSLARTLQDQDLQRKYQESIRAQTAGYGEATRQRGEVTADVSRKRSEVVADASRRRTEQAQPLSALQTIAGTNAQFGVPSVTTPGTNPWDKVLDLLATGAGAALGAKKG